MKPVTLSDLGDERLRGKNSLYKFLWRVAAMPTIKGIEGGTYTLPPLNVETITLPLPRQGVTQAEVAATTIYFADKGEIDQFNMICKEDDKLTSLQYFIEWNKSIQNPYTGGFYLPSRYKKNFEVVLFDGGGKPTMTALLIGVWPNTIQEMELDATDDKHKINVSFSVDAMIPTFINKSG